MSGVLLSLPLRLAGAYRRTFSGDPGAWPEPDGQAAGDDRGGLGRLTAVASILLRDVGRVQPPIDMVVLSRTAPGTESRTATGTESRTATGADRPSPVGHALVDAVAGGPTTLFLPELSRGAPFTGLRLAASGPAGDPLAQVLVLVLENRTLCWDGPGRPPTVDTGVALLLRRVPSGDTGIRLQEHADVGPDEIREVLASQLAVVAGGTALVMAGLSIAIGQCDGLGFPVTYSAVTALCTSNWELLAAATAARRPGEPPIQAVLVEYDSVRRLLCLAAIDLPDR